MKALITISAGLILLAGLCINTAAQEITPTVIKARPTPKIMIFTGVIDILTYADQEKQTETEMKLLGKDNKSMTFIITAQTKLYNTEGKLITIDALKKDDLVTTRYIVTKDNKYEAQQVRISR